MRFLAAVYAATEGRIGAGWTVAVSDAMRSAQVPAEQVSAALEFARSRYWVDTLPAFGDHVWLTAMGEDLARATFGLPKSKA